MQDPGFGLVTRYGCPACGRTYSARASARQHIARCWHNPDNKGCKTCVNFYPGDEGCASEEHCQAGLDLPLTDQGNQTLAVHCARWVGPATPGGWDGGW